MQAFVGRAKAAFYVRVHSPVVWIEVDCQAPGPLAGAYGATQGSGATQKHVHSVVAPPTATTDSGDLITGPGPRRPGPVSRRGKGGMPAPAGRIVLPVGPPALVGLSSELWARALEGGR